MARTRRGELGQTMILFALLGTALVGALALVIDVGQMYMVQRNLQNVADEAALVGAQNRSGGINNLSLTSAAVADARRYAKANGVNNDAGANDHVWNPSWDNGVLVHWPPMSGYHVGDLGYLEVVVAKTIGPTFAGVFNRNNTRIQARAVARGFGGYAEAAIIALDEDTAAIKAGGSQNTNVVGSIYSRGGIFANSTGGTMTVSGWAYCRWAVTGGGVSAAGGIVEGAPDISDPNWPTPTATSTLPGGRWGSVHYAPDAYGWRHIYPGTYSSISVGSGDHVMFHPGVYRITGQGVKIQGFAAGLSTTPFPSPYTYDDPPVGAPLSFVLDDGTTFEITADGTAHFTSSADYANLIIRSSDDKNAVKIVGQGQVNLYGTVYAPAGDIALAGNSGGTVNGQVVGGTVEVLGGTGPAVIWDRNRVPPTRRSVLVE